MEPSFPPSLCRISWSLEKVDQIPKRFLASARDFSTLIIVVDMLRITFSQALGLSVPAFFRLLLFICGCVPFFSQEASANVNVQFANMKQDMELVSRELAGLRTEVELLRRENAQLRVTVEQLTRRQNSTSGDARGLSRQMDARLQSLERRASQGEKEQIALQKNFDKKLKDLIAEMNAAFSQVNGPSTNGASGASFSTDYPKNGFVHKVEKGETVSSIAVKYSSKIKWIIDSNRISDPTKVFVGKELFVPQK